MGKLLQHLVTYLDGPWPSLGSFLAVSWQVGLSTDYGRCGASVVEAEVAPERPRRWALDELSAAVVK